MCGDQINRVWNGIWNTTIKFDLGKSAVYKLKCVKVLRGRDIDTVFARDLYCHLGRSSATTLMYALTSKLKDNWRNAAVSPVTKTEIFRVFRRGSV